MGMWVYDTICICFCINEIPSLSTMYQVTMPNWHNANHWVTNMKRNQGFFYMLSIPTFESLFQHVIDHRYIIRKWAKNDDLESSFDISYQIIQKGELGSKNKAESIKGKAIFCHKRLWYNHTKEDILILNPLIFRQVFLGYFRGTSLIIKNPFITLKSILDILEKKDVTWKSYILIFTSLLKLEDFSYGL